MVADMLCSLSRENSLEEAVLYGLSCGTATIKSPRTELLTKEDVEQLYKDLREQVYK